jgi:AcrR family transcriptional regulator
VTAPDIVAAGGVARPFRSRDAAASRRALLEAAQDLFGTLGFERTTVREIGERAGVDAALIARYFGSKADLYIAAVAAERMDDQSLPEYEGLAHIVETMVARVDRLGPGPILQALARSDTPDDIRTAARARLARRLVDPLVSDMDGDGGDRAQLRAEIAVSALVGVVLGRSLGWFGELGSEPADEVVDLIVRALEGLTGAEGDGIGDGGGQQPRPGPHTGSGDPAYGAGG